MSITLEKPIIELKEVTRTFKVGEIDVEALRGIDVSISEGEFIVILGASGCGKTTLLNQIGGIDLPNQGTVIVNNKDLTKYSDKELTRHRRSTIGWIFQFHNLIPSLTAMENVQLALELMGVNEEAKEKSKKALISVGLEDEIYRFPSQLSGGQQQRVAVARALVKEPKIIVADEPTGNLDRKTGRLIVELMVELCKSQGITFVVVTHDPSLSEVADRVLHMEDGQIINTTSGK
jgi:putative ABC transport system ATP-binding protein